MQPSRRRASFITRRVGALRCAAQRMSIPDIKAMDQATLRKMYVQGGRLCSQATIHYHHHRLPSTSKYSSPRQHHNLVHYDHMVITVRRHPWSCLLLLLTYFHHPAPPTNP